MRLVWNEGALAFSDWIETMRAALDTQGFAALDFEWMIDQAESGTWSGSWR